MFLRSLRALRNLRRRAPPRVLVQNAAQVNVGQQQLKVATSPAEDEPAYSSAASSKSLCCGVQMML
jgi:hypothetical protein